MTEAADRTDPDHKDLDQTAGTFPQPLFILCPGRSFSSVISSVIGQHPQAFGLPEVNLFSRDLVGDLIDYDVPFVGLSGVASGLRRAVAELKYGGQTDATVSRAERWLSQRRDWTGARMFGELCQLAAPRMVVDKSPSNTQVQAIERLFAAFPNARYLHISRHPRATSRSRAKAYDSRLKLKALVGDVDHHTYWQERHEIALRPAREFAPGQYMFLHGEWFFEDPRAVLVQICQWLDLSTDAAALDRMMRPEDSPFAVVGPARARYGNNKGFIENPHLRVGKIREENLDDPLEWMEPDETHFSDGNRALAHQLGYAK